MSPSAHLHDSTTASFIRFAQEMVYAGLKLEAIKLLKQVIHLSSKAQDVKVALDELTTGINKTGHYKDEDNHFVCDITYRARQLMAEQSGAPLHPFFVAMPHSGSTYISKKVAEALKTTWFPVHAGYELDQYILDWTKLGKSIRNRGVSICHIPASRGNRIVLRQHVTRCVVHVRDPRQSILSWIHKIESKLNNKEYEWYERIAPALPQGYASMSLEDRLWWQLENEFLKRVDMVQGWMDYQATNEAPVKILFTTHHDLKQFPQLLFTTIMNYFNLPSNYFNLEINRGESRKYNFRKGSCNEWQEVYSEEQKKYADKILTDAMKTRFEWS